MLEKHLENYSQGSIALLDDTIPFSKYTPLDLSGTNNELSEYNMGNPYSCQEYINEVLKRTSAEVAYGGYLEKRSLYAKEGNFIGSGKTPRNIHMGMDFWAPSGTKVLTPIDGEVHSFKNNTTKGDYGPTIILKHQLAQITFYTLYGHLSLESISELYVGKKFKSGMQLATLGTPAINVNYAPHLHFQIIKDIQEYYGDYPGVCSADTLEFYFANCPDPNLLLKI